ncbi:aldehyde dehydrogenase family protein [Solimonas terrae]|uniref:Aldehyde dehydrogenase n=1 Tax=Solimonas terrae TaxID=1396819 RepID=A0A6M2BPM2_9GAMM|nr:aldehyde dehydrogenase family protein [Solimonas terrae]NGY04314.1 aldehyde dehydrogenase family protein [Solimonas terrae]
MTLIPESPRSGAAARSTDADDLQKLLRLQRAAVIAEGYVAQNVREDRLDRATAMMLAHRKRLLDAIMQDFGARGRDWSLLTEVFLPVQLLMAARKQLGSWMQAERRQAPMPFRLFGARAEIQYQPLGVIGIMGAWNAPINLVLAPMVTALAAGNRAMLCPSDMMPASAAALAAAVDDYFDASELAVVAGGLETSKAFSALRFDHLMFTGSPAVGAQVMAAAAPNLTPVTLELGGKCPVILGDDADLDDSAARLIAAKTLNGGQACLAPDLLFVPRRRLDDFITRLDAKMAALYPGSVQNPDYCGVVNERHYRRLGSLLAEAGQLGARVVPLGLAGADLPTQDDAQRRLALHAIIDPPDGARALGEELFGPVMVIIPYDDVQRLCTRLREMEKPLGLYVFSGRSRFVQKVLDGSYSGGVTVNDAMFHYSVPDLPFGGVGRSGMGSYSFGIEGFRRFSHARSVYHQAGPAALMRVLQPPYGRLFDLAVRKNLDRLARRYEKIPGRTRA